MKKQPNSEEDGSLTNVVAMLVTSVAKLQVEIAEQNHRNAEMHEEGRRSNQDF